MENEGVVVQDVESKKWAIRQHLDMESDSDLQ